MLRRMSFYNYLILQTYFYIGYAINMYKNAKDKNIDIVGLYV